MKFSENIKVDNVLTEHRQMMREINYQICSNRPLIYICTHEENRVIDALKAICQRDDHKKWELYSWDIAASIQNHTGTEILPQQDQTTILNWFDAINTKEQNGLQILVLKDFHKLIGSDGNAGPIEYTIIRELRNQSQANISRHKCIIMVGTSLFLPPELEKLCTVIDWPLPEKYHISEKIKEVIEWAGTYSELKGKFQTQYTESEFDEIISSFQGLTLTEIELLCSYMIQITNKFDPVVISTAKRDIIRKSGLIDWVDAQNDMSAIGGLDELKLWLKKRKNAFTKDAKDYGLPENPKGVLLVGIQGAGKSLSAQAIAKFWNLPLLRLDMGKVFAGIVGSSEENIRSVIKVAESISPCVIWIDEIDKGLAGTKSSNNTDGGTAARVFGSLLNWMQEKKKPVYIAATANDVSQLPPELLRKGRFDEIFFVDLPSECERKEIFKIHLKKRKRDYNNYNIELLVSKTDNFTGAEIESVIISAMYESFDDNKREFTTKDIIDAIENTVPLATTMKEQINKLRAWAQTRARNASIPDSKKSIIKEYEKIEQMPQEDDEEEEL